MIGQMTYEYAVAISAGMLMFGVICATICIAGSAIGRRIERRRHDAQQLHLRDM